MEWVAAQIIGYWDVLALIVIPFVIWLTLVDFLPIRPPRKKEN
jgi:hypothetical protein